MPSLGKTFVRYILASSDNQRKVIYRDEGDKGDARDRTQAPKLSHLSLLSLLIFLCRRNDLQEIPRNTQWPERRRQDVPSVSALPVRLCHIRKIQSDEIGFIVPLTYFINTGEYRSNHET